MVLSVVMTVLLVGLCTDLPRMDRGNLYGDQPDRSLTIEKQGCAT